MGRRSVLPELTALAARLVVDEGMEYGPAKRRAARQLGRAGRIDELPDNDELEDEIREHLELFCADTQPAELRALREVACSWMQRLPAFRPHLSGAVWRGTATRLSTVHLDLYCDDSKAAEIELLNLGVRYEVDSGNGPRGEPVDLLVTSTPSPALGETVTVCLKVLDTDDLRGALKPDSRGRTERGDLRGLQRLLNDENPLP
jgi:hypothetical protein